MNKEISFAKFRLILQKYQSSVEFRKTIANAIPDFIYITSDTKISNISDPNRQFDQYITDWVNTGIYTFVKHPIWWFGKENYPPGPHERIKEFVQQYKKLI